MTQETQQIAFNIIAGGAAGATGALITCPLEVLKTRLQSGNRSTLVSPFSSSVHSSASHEGTSNLRRLASFVRESKTWTALLSIAEKEGIRGLWKGLGPTLVGVIPSRATYFSVYSSTKQYLTAQNGHQETPVVHFASAGIAGCTATTLTNPLWMIKTRLQLETQRSSGSFTTAVNIIRREGILNLWQGLSASYLGIFETCLQWVIYEKMKQLYRQDISADNSDPGPLLLFSFASVSKLVASISWYPHEVARTRLREEGHTYRGLFDCFRRMIKEEGPLRLYSGMGVHLLRVVPNSAITFMTFELIVRAFDLQTQKKSS